MTADEVWRLDRARLREVLTRWERQLPNRTRRRAVEEFLMDLVLDPLGRGLQDGTSGVFAGIAGSDVVVVYVPDPASRTVFVVDINTG